MDQQGGNKFLRFITSPLFIGAFFSMDAVIVRLLLYPKFSYLITADSLLIQNFIEWFGVTYGLFIALVLVNVWTQYDTTKREFDREADAIFMLYQAAKQIKETDREIKRLKGRIIKGIEKYVVHVNDNYLEEHRRLNRRDAGDLILDEIRNEIGDVVHTSEKEAITGELIKEFNEAVDLRGDRISHSKQRIPKPVWGITLASSILWLLPFLGLDFVSDGVAILLVGGVTAIVVAILVIIKDLDDPFDGTWKIDITEWELLAEKLGIRRTLILVFNVNSSQLYRLWNWLNGLFSIQLCKLHSLLKKSDYRIAFLESVNNLAYSHLYYRDEFESLYERTFSYPIVLNNSGSTLNPLVSADEINSVHTANELGDLLLQRLERQQRGRRNRRRRTP